MTELAPVLVDCVLCRHPLVEQINRQIKEGGDHGGIARAMRWMAQAELDVPHRNTFSTHKREHLSTAFERERLDAKRRLEAQQKTLKAKAGDLAALVRDNVYARVEEGELEPTLGEGLRAQEMLDRRAQAGADRDLMVTLAGLLSGATSPVALLGDGNTIEGEFREVSAEAREDTETFAALLTG
jgi:hypothetical protein